MNRRRFLEATATVGTIGLLAGCLNSEASENGSTTENEDDSTTEDGDTPTTDEPTETETATSTPDDPATKDSEPIGDGTTTEPDGSGSVGWSSGGVMDGVSFEFSSQAPECSGKAELSAINETDIEFDTDAEEIVVRGVISGSDLCKRARLTDLTYDREESHLSVAIESVDREDCDAGGQCIVGIPYEGTFSFDDGIPDGASVSHNGQGVASAAHGSASVGPPSETADE